MPDIFVYDLLRALGLGGCPLCRALDDDEERWIDSFWREGRQSPAARKQFFAAGGFCRDHAWLLHRLVDAAGSGAAIADLYGQLATNDLRRIEQVAARLAHSRRGAARLRRRRPCPACAFRAAALDRKVQFFLEALGEGAARDAYRRSDGLCFPDLARVVEAGFSAGRKELTRFLLDDWFERLADVRSQLAEYDRRRDYRYAAEPKGVEQRAWTDVICRYVGTPSRR